MTDTLPEVCVTQDISQDAQAASGERTVDAGLRNRDSAQASDASSATTSSQTASNQTAASGRPDAAAEPLTPSTESELPVPDAGEAGACADGFETIAGRCTCDLAGTFALHAEIAVRITAQSGIEAGSDTAHVWAMIRQSYDGDDQLALSLTDCGRSDPEICGAGVSVLLDPEAYAQYIPAAAWRGRVSATASRVTMRVPDGLPNTAFVSPEFALLRGLSLDDPLGEWPSTRKDVEGGPDYDGSAVNGARWIDHDDDEELGVASLVVPPGGIAAGQSDTAPEVSYGASSKTCPRGDGNAPRSPYGYVPAAEGISLRRIKRIQQATRLSAALSGRVESCDRIAGELIGPNAGAARLDVRVAGCVLASGSGEAACPANVLDLTERSGTLALGSLEGPATFLMQRVADGVSCADVREMAFE